MFDEKGARSCFLLKLQSINNLLRNNGDQRKKGGYYEICIY